MEKVLETWLSHQCWMLSGSIRALLLTGPPDAGPFDRAVSWPENNSNPAALYRVAQAALHLKQAVIRPRINEIEATSEPLDILASPLVLGERFFGVVAVEMTHRSQQMHQEAVQQIQAGAKWLEAMMSLHASTAKEQLIHLVDLVAAVMEPVRFRVAATDVANELAEHFSCHRVSLGFLRHRDIRVEAMSNSSQIDQGSNLVRAIRDAMGESLDQGRTVLYPGPSGSEVLITRFHEQLSKAQQGAAICTVPLGRNGNAVGALVMERALQNPFTPETVEQCERIGVLLGPVLETRRSEERPLPRKILDSVRSGLGRLFGPHHLPLKLGGALGLSFLIWLCLAQGTLRISSDSVLEADIRRAVVAPQQGYIAAAQVRAGDLVRQGDLMATLDDRDLQLQLRKYQSQHAQLLEEYRKALAGFNRSELSILKAKILQAEAQLNLVRQQLDRITLVAPLAGLVVKGDLSQALGSPVERGQVLFEVAPTEQYRVVLKVDDRDMGLVKQGQRGEVKLAGIPDRSIGIMIDRLTPVATSEDARNYFRVEALMDSHSDLMRPGMEGIAKIDVGRESLLRIWTRGLMDWLRLFVWSRLP